MKAFNAVYRFYLVATSRLDTIMFSWLFTFDYIYIHSVSFSLLHLSAQHVDLICFSHSEEATNFAEKKISSIGPCSSRPYKHSTLGGLQGTTIQI